MPQQASSVCFFPLPCNSTRLLSLLLHSLLVSSLIFVPHFFLFHWINRTTNVSQLTYDDWRKGYYAHLRRRLFSTTLTELKAIKAEAHMGVI